MVSLPLALLMVGIQMVLALSFLLVQGSLTFLGPEDLADVQGRVLDAMDHLGEFGVSVWWDLARAAGAGAGAWWLARRQRIPGAAFLGTVAIVLLAGAAMNTGRWFADWSWTLSGVDLIVVLAIDVSLVCWAAAGTLTERRAEWSLYLLLLTALLRQATFIADPFAALLAFTGGAFVLFGLVWGFATGGSWANEGSRRLPRLSRVQLLLGYQVLSTAILHWYLVSHELAPLEHLTEDVPGTGTAFLGQPLLLLLLLSAMVSAWADVPIRSADAEEAAAEPAEEAEVVPAADP